MQDWMKISVQILSVVIKKKYWAIFEMISKTSAKKKDAQFWLRLFNIMNICMLDLLNVHIFCEFTCAFYQFKNMKISSKKIQFFFVFPATISVRTFSFSSTGPVRVWDRLDEWQRPPGWQLSVEDQLGLRGPVVFRKGKVQKHYQSAVHM